MKRGGDWPRMEARVRPAAIALAMIRYKIIQALACPVELKIKDLEKMCSGPLIRFNPRH